jgi:hypothetical protein
MWEPQCLTTLWASMACYRDSFTFYLYSDRSRSSEKVDMITYLSERFKHTQKRYSCPCNRPWRSIGLCETSRLPHFLDSRLTDGDEVVSLTRRPPSTPSKVPRTHLYEAESTPGPQNHFLKLFIP